MGSFSQPVWQFDTLLTYYKLLMVPIIVIHHISMSLAHNIRVPYKWNYYIGESNI